MPNGNLREPFRIVPTWECSGTYLLKALNLGWNFFDLKYRIIFCDSSLLTKKFAKIFELFWCSITRWCLGWFDPIKSLNKLFSSRKTRLSGLFWNLTYYRLQKISLSGSFRIVPRCGHFYNPILQRQKYYQQWKSWRYDSNK